MGREEAMPEEKIRDRGGVLEKPRLPRLAIIVFLVLSVVIILSGYLYTINYHAQLKNRLSSELAAIADFKVKDIQNWLRQDIEAVRLLSNNRVFIDSAKRLSQNPSDPTAKDAIRDVLALLWGSHGACVGAFASDGRLLFSYPDTAKPLEFGAHRVFIDRVLETNDVSFTDFHRETQTGEIRLGVFFPINLSDKEHLPSAVGYIQIDPSQYLYPLIQSWPTPRKSAETLLVRRQADEVLFLNELRHKKHTALEFRVPLANKEIVAVQAITHGEGTYEGLDYRGVRVVAVTRQVPGTSWHLVSKIDRDEIYRPLRSFDLFMFAVVSLSLLVCFIALFLFWREQALRFYRREHRLTLEREALARHFDYLVKYANDIIILFDEDMNITEANDKAIETYGYSREEFLRLKITELRPPQLRDEVGARLREAEELGGIIYETEHVRKDSSRIFVEISLRFIAVADRKYYQSIIRDITERKKAEEAMIAANQQLRALNQQLRANEQQLRAANQQLRASQQQLYAEAEGRKKIEEQLRYNEAQLSNALKIARLGPWEYDVINDVFTFNDAFYAIFRTTAEQVGGYTMSAQDYARRFLHPEDAPLVALETRKAIEAKDPNFSRQLEHRIIFADGEPGYITVRFFIVKDKQGNTIKTFGVNQDITERKKAEKELAEKVHSLEVFYKSSIGREEKIIELKATVEKLKERIRELESQTGRG